MYKFMEQTTSQSNIMLLKDVTVTAITEEFGIHAATILQLLNETKSSLYRRDQLDIGLIVETEGRITYRDSETQTDFNSQELEVAEILSDLGPKNIDKPSIDINSFINQMELTMVEFLEEQKKINDEKQEELNSQITSLQNTSRDFIQSRTTDISTNSIDKDTQTVAITTEHKNIQNELSSVALQTDMINIKNAETQSDQMNTNNIGVQTKSSINKKIQTIQVDTRSINTQTISAIGKTIQTETITIVHQDCQTNTDKITVSSQTEESVYANITTQTNESANSNSSESGELPLEEVRKRKVYEDDSNDVYFQSNVQLQPNLKKTRTGTSSTDVSINKAPFTLNIPRVLKEEPFSNQIKLIDRPSKKSYDLRSKYTILN
jgi:hypothetical protein